jgi:hypothetical protein
MKHVKLFEDFINEAKRFYLPQMAMPPKSPEAISFQKELKAKFPKISFKIREEDNFVEAFQTNWPELGTRGTSRWVDGDDRAMVTTWWFKTSGEVTIDYYIGEYSELQYKLGSAKTAKEAVALAEPKIKDWNRRSNRI